LLPIVLSAIESACRPVKAIEKFGIASSPKSFSLMFMKRYREWC
jgi:hypothetical protein